MSNFEHAKYDADGVRIDDPTFNTQALRNDTSLVNGITFPAANTVAINTNSVERFRVGNEGQTTILAASSSPALKVTQTGAGNAFVVEDSASTDSTPFVITSNGQVLLGTDTPLFSSNAGLQLASENASAPNSGIYSARFSTDGTGGIINVTKARGTKAAPSIVANTDALGTIQFNGYDGTNGLVAAAIVAAVDGTPGTNDMPGRLMFSTTADGASSPTERMRIDSTGNVGIGSTSLAGFNLRVSANVTGATSAYGIASRGQVQSDVTGSSYSFATFAGFAAFAAASHRHYSAEQGTIATSLTNQFGYEAGTTLTGATNNYGFYGNIAAGANRYNFYAAGTANNAYAGNSSFGKVTAPTSAVDTTSFAVGFATNSAATCTVGATDHTIVQTTTASTYTLPSAASFPGRILKLLTQFAGTVVSASSNVVPIAGGAAGTAILAATAGKYAVLQSNGTNWQITEAN